MASVDLGQSPPSSTYNGTGEGLPFFQGKVAFQRLHPIPRIWCTDARKFAEPGDILISVRAPVGDVNVATEHCGIGRGLAAIRPGPDSDPWFLYFALLYSKPALEFMATGSTFASVNKNTLNGLDIPFFDRLTQAAIGRFLHSLVYRIEQEDEAVRIAQALKRAAMRTLFARGLRDEPQKETEIGPVPESWKVTTIDDVAMTTQYGLSVCGRASGTYPILRMNCQEDGKVHYRDLQFVDLDSESYDRFRVKPGDLLFNRTNSIDLVGRMAIIEDDRPAVFASYLVRLVVDADRCIPEFLNHFMNWPRTQGEIKKLASRAVGQANINATKLRTVQFPLPAIDEQQNIVAILEAIDRKIDLHQKKRAVLDDLFKVLLHKLMRGEIRVAELDLSALEETTSSSRVYSG